MVPAGRFGHPPVVFQQRVDVSEVRTDRDLVALAFVAFAPLVVVVENQRDDVVEIVDEPVRRRRRDRAVKAIVEI